MNKITGKLLDIKQSGANDIYHVLADKDYYITLGAQILNKRYSSLSLGINDFNLFRNNVVPILVPNNFSISIDLFPGQLGTKLNGKDFTVVQAPEAKKPKTIDSSNKSAPKDKQPNTDASPADSNTSHQWPDLPTVSNFTPVPCLTEPGLTRIGYAQFDNPINYVEHSRTSGIISVPVMRQSSTLKAGLGKAYESYTISYLANGPDEIKRSVQEVFEQISLNPFTTVSGDLFGAGRAIKYDAIAVRNFSVSTVDSLPGALAVNISFDPFLWHWYLPFAIGTKFDRFKFDDAICWPLVKIWTKSRERSIYDGAPFSGKMSLAFPSDSTVDQLSSILGSQPNSVSTDINSLQALKSIISGGSVLSRNVKKLNYAFVGPNKPIIAFIKVSSKTLWNELTPYAGTGSTNYIGLVRWDKIKTSNLVDDGALLPQSADVRPIDLNQKMDPYKPFDITSLTNLGSSLGIIDIPRTYQGPIGSSADEIANPWNYFAIVYQFDPKNTSQFAAKLDKLITTQNRDQTVDFQSVTEKLNNLSFESNTTTIFDSNAESDVVIQRISGSRGHKLAVTSGQENPLPIHTYMGGIDATFVVEGTCFGLDAKSKLESLKEEFDNRAISTTYNKLTTIGKEAGNRGSGAAFMKVKNEIFQLLGVNFVLPITLSFQSIDGQPDAWGFSLTFLEFDPKLKASEQIRFLPTNWESLGKVYEYGYQSTNSNPILDRAKEYFSLEASLAQEEVYPDMDLPTIAELNLWVATLKEIGTVWNNLGTNNDPIKLINQVKQSKSFSNPKVASQLIDWTADYFLNYATRISKWNAEPLVTKRESISRVDPDFYIYYEPENSWEAVLDGVSEQLMGKPNKLRAEGRKSDDTDKPYVSPIRFYDTHHNTIHTYDATWFASNPHMYDVEKQTNDAYDAMEPKEHADKVKALYEQGRKDFEATPGNWWSKGYDLLIDGKDTNKNLAFTPEQESELYKDSGSIGSPHAPSDSIKDASIPDFSQYFDVGWRRKFLLSCANMLPARPFSESSEDWLTVSNTFFFNPDTILTDLDKYNAAFIDTGSAILGLGGSEPIFNSSQNVTFSDLENLMRSIIKSYDGVETSSSIPLGNAEELTGNDHPWLFRSAYYSSVSKYYANGGNQSFVGGSTPQDIIINNINYLCATYPNIDPNIIIAVFNFRDGFGTITRPSGVKGDWKSSLASSINTYPNAIDLFAKTYASNMGRFSSIPSIALLATELQLAEGYDQYLDPATQDLTKDALARLSKAATNAASTGRTTQQAGAAIQDALNSFGTAGTIVNNYFTYYIQTCRSLGTCLFPNYASNSDCYFNPLSQLNFIDESDDASTMTLSNFSPTGTPVEIDATRKQVVTIPEIATRGQETFDPNAISSATQAALIQRFRAALSPHTEGAIYGSLVDFRKYSAYHRLVRAYPSFQILLINEGWYWASGNKKLWDQFYTRTGVSSIEIFKTRKQPGGTCKITFSNMFYYITAYNQMEVLQQELAVKNNKRLGAFVSLTSDPTKGAIGNAITNAGQLFNEFFMKNVPDEVKEIYRNNHLKQLALSSGTRIQVRMGWGSDASQLHTTFNGMVVEAPVDDCYVQLVCVSDGYELEKPATTNLTKAGNSYAYADSGALGSGKDPSNIVTEALIACSLGDNLFQGNFRDWSQGVSHFGDIYFNQFQTGNFTHSAAEVQINIYSSNPTTLEQGISQYRNYNIFAGLTNWDKTKNLFGVEVQEATPWKVMEVCRRACSDFVASSETFANRSTAFFGKWWWPYNYSYDPSILDNYKVPLQNVQAQIDRYVSKLPDQPSNPGDQTVLDKIPKVILDIIDQQDPNLKNKITDYIEHSSARTDLSVDTIRHSADLDVSYLDLDRNYYVALGTQSDRFQYGGLRFVKKLRPDQSNSSILEKIGAVGQAVGIPGVSLLRALRYDIVFAGELKKSEITVIFSNINSGNVAFNDTADVNSARDHLIGDALTDVKNLVPYLKWKTYLQAYFAHSGINLLSNNIIADGTDVYTDAIGMHQGNWYVGPSSVSKTITYSLDSIPGYCPVTILRNGRLDILPIEDLCPTLSDVDDKQYFDNLDFLVLSEKGWTKPNYLMAHKVNKPIYSVNGHTGLVDVTEDHSIMIEGRETKPKDCLGKKITTIKIPEINLLEDVDLDIAYLYGAFVAEGTSGTYQVWNKRHKKFRTISSWAICNTDREWLLKVSVGLSKLGWGISLKTTAQQKSGKTLYILRALGSDENSVKTLSQKFSAECYLKNRKEKRVPEFILNSSNNVMQAFLDGYYFGDGIKEHAKVRDMSRPYGAFESRDYTLIAQIHYIVQRLTECQTSSITVSTKERSRGYVDYYRIVPRILKGQGTSWLKETNIVKDVRLSSRQESIVYDFETESHTFCAGVNNVLVHNTNISPSMRKTAMVDTGLLITGGQQGAKPLAEFAGTALEFVSAGLIPANEYIRETPTTPAVNNAVVAFLVDSAKDMYQGWFTMTGQPSIKPRDLILLNDLKIQLAGPVFVKEVVHKMDSEIGFITMISPDAVAMPADNIFGQQMILSLVTGALKRTASWMVLKGAWATIKYMMTAEDSRVAKYLTTEALSKYNKLLDVAGKSKPEILDKIKSQLVSSLRDQIKTLDTSLETADGDAITKIGAKIADLQKTVEDIENQSSIEGVLRRARLKGLNIDSAALTTDPILGEQIAFEIKLEADAANELRTELKAGVTGLSPEEVKSVVNARANTKRENWIKSRLAKADEIIAQDAGLADELARTKTLIKQINAANISGKLSTSEEDLLRALNDSVSKLSEGGVNADLSSLTKGVTKIISGSNKEFGALSSILEESGGLNTVAANAARVGARIGESVAEGLKSATSLPVGIINALSSFSKSLGGIATKRSAKGVFYLPTSELSAKLKTRDVWKAFTTPADERDTTEILKITRNIKDIATGTTTTSEEVITATKLINTIKKDSPAKLIKTFKEVKNGVMLLSNTNPFSAVIYDTAMILLGDSLVGGINARLRARNCVKIFPLKAGKSEFTAGIRGHQGAVIGDHPGWADEFLFNTLTGGFIPEGHENARMIYTIMVGALGFEPPIVGEQNIDNKWIEEWNSLNGDN